MPRPGDVVLCNFLGAQGRKWRPGVVVSADIYHANSRDVIVGELTTRLAKASNPISYVLQEWSAAGLHQASAFRLYLMMATPQEIVQIGRLTDRDWREVQARLRAGVAVA